MVEATPNDETASDEKVAYVHERIHDALHGNLDDQWDEVLMEWEAASPGQRQMVKTHVSGLRNRVWDSLSAIDSLGGLEKGLAIQYVELKARWTMLNTKIQSQTARGAEPDEELTYRATCISLIIQALEPLLRQGQVDALTERLHTSVG